jgi:predicted amidohydrolase
MSRLGIACVQLEALGLERAEEALERALQGVEEAGRHRPDLILLPECTYPAYYLHSLEAYHRAEPRPLEEVLHLFGEKARRHRAYVAVGLVRPHPSGRLRNSMALLDPQGQVLGFHDKLFLWHFDREWFDPGSDLPVFDLPFGRVGLMICADARMPEIPRALAMQGARLILDATALVTSTGAPEARTNPQVTYLLPARALENGLWIAWANKVGAGREHPLLRTKRRGGAGRRLSGAGEPGSRGDRAGGGRSGGGARPPRAALRVRSVVEHAGGGAPGGPAAPGADPGGFDVSPGGRPPAEAL